MQRKMNYKPTLDFIKRKYANDEAALLHSVPYRALRAQFRDHLAAAGYTWIPTYHFVDCAMHPNADAIDDGQKFECGVCAWNKWIHSQEDTMATQHTDAYTMIDAAIRLADTLEDAGRHGESVTARQLAEYIERTVVPIELRRA